MFVGPNDRPAKPWWLDAFVKPITADQQAGNDAAAQKLLALAREKIAQGELDPDNACALGMFMSFLDFKGAHLRLDEQHLPELFHNALGALRQPPAGPISALSAHMLLLELLINGHHLGQYQLSVGEFRALFNAVPAQGRSHHFWYFSSGYAFLEGMEDIVTEAYKLYLVNPTGRADYYTVQRLKVMLHLMQGRCQKEDILELLRRMQTVGHISEFNRVFFERIEEAGLVDHDMLDLLFSKQGEILTQGPIYLPAEKERVTRGRVQVNL